MPEPANSPALRQKILKLFEFLKAYIDLKYPPVRNIKDQPGVLWLEDFPAHSSIELNREDGTREHGDEDSGVVLRLSRPLITECPRPPIELHEWLQPGWRDVNGNVQIHPSRNKIGENGRTSIEAFSDDPGRSLLLDRWRQMRAQWVVNERPAREALRFFQSVYEWYGAIEREGERIELLVGDGVVRCSDANGEFHHPVLLQKLELEFYPEKQRPQFVFRKREQPPELYLEFLRALPAVNLKQLGRCADELKEAEFAPLGGDDTTGFLRRLVQGLFPSAGSFSGKAATGSEGNGTSADSSGSAPAEVDPTAPTLQRRPAVFMRHRRTGPSNIFDLVLEDIASRSDFSPALVQMLGAMITAGATTQSQPGERAKSLGNEDPEVLFGKPANREQLDIAKQLARRDCVVVQGPPGTGKTHTIANMLGHLLAQGKRVLVTAHTSKALKVLRQKVVEEIQPLCVSVLHNDKQSQDELQTSVRKIHVRLSEDPVLLERDVERLRSERARLLKALAGTRRELLDARQDEIREVIFGGKAMRPIEAAKAVRAGNSRHDWIPGPVTLGEAIPLSHAEIAALYQSNARVSLDDERELAACRPDLTLLPTPREFRQTVDEANALAREDLQFREELWEQGNAPDDLTDFDRMLALANKTIEFLRSIALWQLEAVQAGRDGEHAREVWVSLVHQIETTWREANDCHLLVMEHGPTVSGQRLPHDLVLIVDEIIEHARDGKSFGLLTKLTKRHWFEFRETVRVGVHPLDFSKMDHLRAVRALLRMEQLRADLRQRWSRQMAEKGAIHSTELGERPEQACKQFVPFIQQCLDWHSAIWQPLEREFERVGFNCGGFLDRCAPEAGDHAELRRLRRAVVEELSPILQARSGFLRHERLTKKLLGWREQIQRSKGAVATATQRMRQALFDLSPAEYESAHAELSRLKNLEPDLVQRGDLLRQLARSAPAWASAIKNRVPLHSAPLAPGEPDFAWDWRQLHDELERRAGVSLDQLQVRTEQIGQQLLELTSQLIEKQTWLFQIRQTGMAQKQALGAYAALRNKLTKTGKGVKDAELRTAARREMETAKDAVPVWIMPLAEVAETFDPRKTRFDVVIIDEASQCDPTALFALYMANQSIIVGDDEQVTPVAVGVDASEVMKLIRIFLDGVPYKELYDGETSIYELAQIAFGGVIRLTEHFRCAPNIIAFSNNLSYKGEIKPLREASMVPIRPHVVHYRVKDGHDRADNVNEVEAETVASLICAAIQQSEYEKNDAGKPTTFGVVSLVGNQQALRIDTLLRQRLEPAEYRRRQILCGDSAQFQGDERDVMFLSVVDGPPVTAPLSMRQEGPKRMFKKRYNVAASRARNQMWVVHSLNHQTDLQLGDYRRRLIEHSLDPTAWERELHQRLEAIDSRSTAFEGPVLRRLMERGFDVVPQYQAGAYRIDLVVIGTRSRLAIECDGEQFHGPERLQEDLDRQAILERLGWKFVRIRGSLFFRDEDRAMEPVLRRLAELGIQPGLKTGAVESEADETVLKIIRAADMLRDNWHSESENPSAEADHEDGSGRAYSTDGTSGAFGRKQTGSVPYAQDELFNEGRNSDSDGAATSRDFAKAAGALGTSFRRLTIQVSDGSLRQNLLPLAEYVNSGAIRIGELLEIVTSAGDRFVTDVVEQGKKLRARGEIREFYRKAAVRPDDVVILEEGEGGVWRLSNRARGQEEDVSSNAPSPVNGPVVHRGPATLRDILGK